MNLYSIPAFPLSHIRPFPHFRIHYFKDSPYLAPKWLKAIALEVFRWFSGMYQTVPDCFGGVQDCSGGDPGRSVLFLCRGLVFHILVHAETYTLSDKCSGLDIL